LSSYTIFLLDFENVQEIGIFFVFFALLIWNAQK
jgi:hypothetical protein